MKLSFKPSRQMSQTGKIRLTNANNYSADAIAIQINSTERVGNIVVKQMFQNINAN